LSYFGNALPKTHQHGTSVVFTVYEAEWQRWKRRIAAKFYQFATVDPRAHERLGEEA
jgi:hypothetical protein